MAAAGLLALLLNAELVSRWFMVHTGIDDQSGPYYAFWSGFGANLSVFGIITALTTSAYHLARKYNCHEPGCWRVGNHPAAGGRFFLCYRHHPDYQSTRPTSDLIIHLHRDFVARENALHDRLHEIHTRLAEHESNRSAHAPDCRLTPPNDRPLAQTGPTLSRVERPR